MELLRNELVKNVLIGGSAGVFVISVLLATVVFDKVPEDSTAYEPELEMGVAFDATEGHIECFQDMVLYIQTSIDIKNIIKFDEEGNSEPGGLADLFPVGSPATGGGTIELRIKAVNGEKYPSLDNITRELTPMAYVKEDSLPGVVRSMIKLSALGLKYFNLLMGLYVLSLFGTIGLGVILIFLDMSKTPPTPVQSFAGEGDDDDDD